MAMSPMEAMQMWRMWGDAQSQRSPTMQAALNMQRENAQTSGLAQIIGQQFRQSGDPQDAQMAQALAQNPRAGLSAVSALNQMGLQRAQQQQREAQAGLYGAQARHQSAQTDFLTGQGGQGPGGGGMAPGPGGTRWGTPQYEALLLQQSEQMARAGMTEEASALRQSAAASRQHREARRDAGRDVETRARAGELWGHPTMTLQSARATGEPWEKEIADYTRIPETMSLVEGIPSTRMGLIAGITELQKMIDPGAVVRQSDIDLITASLGTRRARGMDDLEAALWEVDTEFAADAVDKVRAMILDRLGVKGRQGGEILRSVEEGTAGWSEEGRAMAVPRLGRARRTWDQFKPKPRAASSPLSGMSSSQLDEIGANALRSGAPTRRAPGGKLQVQVPGGWIEVD